jgi:hypothetical protein
MTTTPDDFERFVGMWADFTPEEDHAFQEILEERAGFMTLKEYAELYNIQLDAEAYRREFPEDEPFTRPPTDIE